MLGSSNRRRDAETVAMFSRRDLVRKGFLWGGALAGASVAVPAVSNAAPARAAGPRLALTFDVACLGQTFHFQMPPGAHPPDDLHGTSFLVEGAIYPAKTIAAGDGFDPASKTSTGRWVCRGWFMITPERPEPHVVTTQEYLFSPIDSGRAPRDQMVSSGLEGTGGADPLYRSLMGGTGRYVGARGQVVQRTIGTNLTQIGPGGALGNAPNFRFEVWLV